MKNPWDNDGKALRTKYNVYTVSIVVNQVSKTSVKQRILVWDQCLIVQIRTTQIVVYVNLFQIYTIVDALFERS